MVLKPISEQMADSSVHECYEKIKKALAISNVPMLFQYIANAREYLFYLWERAEANIHHEQFGLITQQIRDFTLSSMQLVYKPSVRTEKLTESFSHPEKKEVEEIITSLFQIHIMLHVLAIDLREDLKGVSFEQKQLASIQKQEKKDIWEEILQNEFSLVPKEYQTKSMHEAMRVLAPVFGNRFVYFVRYPEFFAAIASDMDHLIQTEGYLKVRVGLERITLLTLSSLPYPLDSSYNRFMELVSDQYVAYELLYFLKTIFPMQFPRLVLTSAAMRIALHEGALGIEA